MVRKNVDTTSMKRYSLSNRSRESNLAVGKKSMKMDCAGDKIKHTFLTDFLGPSRFGRCGSTITFTVFMSLAMLRLSFFLLTTLIKELCVSLDFGLDISSTTILELI